MERIWAGACFRLVVLCPACLRRRRHRGPRPFRGLRLAYSWATYWYPGGVESVWWPTLLTFAG
eukprot:9217152-Lingulodinium_polyedra.AAC.1